MLFHSDHISIFPSMVLQTMGSSFVIFAHVFQRLELVSCKCLVLQSIVYYNFKIWFFYVSMVHSFFVSQESLIVVWIDYCPKVFFILLEILREHLPERKEIFLILGWNLPKSFLFLSKLIAEVQWRNLTYSYIYWLHPRDLSF